MEKRPVSFFEDAPEVPELIAAWVRGYRRFGASTRQISL